jgi:uncharacterized damage-inducible protein DinB
MESDLVQAWLMSCEANRFLLENVPDAALGDVYTPRTRSVARQFSHLHDVRLRWLDAAAPGLARGVPTLPKQGALTRKDLMPALVASREAIASLLEQSAASGKLNAWSGPPATFLGYLVAHEAHHRALAIVALRASGHRLPDEVVYGLWEWGKRSSKRARPAKGG